MEDRSGEWDFYREESRAVAFVQSDVRFISLGVCFGRLARGNSTYERKVVERHLGSAEDVTYVGPLVKESDGLAESNLADNIPCHCV